MTDPIARRPQPGDLVTVGELPGVFRVESFDGATYTLISAYGTVCRAGVRVTRLADEQQRERAA